MVIFLKKYTWTFPWITTQIRELRLGLEASKKKRKKRRREFDGEDEEEDGREKERVTEK